MKVTLRRIGISSFEASAASGGRMLLQGSADLEARISERLSGEVSLPPENASGAIEPMRPMEAFLASLAGCSAMDVVMIITRQREPLSDLQIVVDGTRADAVPAVFERIHLTFATESDVDAKKLERAVALALEKYCSVSKMLLDSVEVSFSTRVGTAS